MSQKGEGQQWLQMADWGLGIADLKARRQEIGVRSQRSEVGDQRNQVQGSKFQVQSLKLRMNGLLRLRFTVYLVGMGHRAWSQRTDDRGQRTEIRLGIGELEN